MTPRLYGMDSSSILCLTSLDFTNYVCHLYFKLADIYKSFDNNTWSMKSIKAKIYLIYAIRYTDKYNDI